MTATSGALRVLMIFVILIFPSADLQTTSVNVPPISMPISSFLFNIKSQTLNKTDDYTKKLLLSTFIYLQIPRLWPPQNDATRTLRTWECPHMLYVFTAFNKILLGCPSLRNRSCQYRISTRIQAIIKLRSLFRQ